MKTDHEITGLLTRAADERRVDLDPLWTRTQQRLATPAALRDNRAVGRRRATVIGAVAATAVIAGSAVVVGSLRDDQRSGSSTEHGPATSSGTSHPRRTPLADDVVRLHRVRLPADQRHVDVTDVEGEHGVHYTGRTIGLGPVHVGDETGALVLTSGQYLQSGQPDGGFVAADFVSHDQSADQAIRDALHGLALAPTSLTSRRPQPQYLWGYDDQGTVFAGRWVLTMGAGPEVRRWVVRFTDGSSVAAQRFTLPGSGGGALYILVGPHLSDVWGRLKDVSWYGPGGTLLHRSDGGGNLP
jgi:hypothetical protein